MVPLVILIFLHSVNQIPTHISLLAVGIFMAEFFATSHVHLLMSLQFKCTLIEVWFCWFVYESPAPDIELLSYRRQQNKWTSEWITQ